MTAIAHHDYSAIAEEYGLPEITADSQTDLGSERYVLFERGHYGQTHLSAWESIAEAGDYALNQECAEDWNAELLLDRVTGVLMRPVAIAWTRVEPLPAEVRYQGEVWMVQGPEYKDGHETARWVLKKSPQDRRRRTYDWATVDPSECEAVDGA